MNNRDEKKRKKAYHGLRFKVNAAEQLRLHPFQKLEACVEDILLQ
jgi:hypothetical protein